MSSTKLTRRQLNRATLARQLLLERVNWSSDEVIHHLVGMQAQVTREPHIGLWTRLHNFQREDLTRLLTQRAVVRATLMRSTLHLFTATDYVLFRTALQPALTRALYSFFGQYAKPLNVSWLVKQMRPMIAAQPRQFTDLRPILAKLDPDADIEAMAYAIRTHVPLVQVPNDSKWGYATNPAFADAEVWFGQPIDPQENARTLVLRYLAAFGPATTRDFQVWSGLTDVKDMFETLRSELAVYHDERGKDVFDLPDYTLPDEEIDAPVRFLPEYDNLILSHGDRERFVPNRYRKLVYLPAGRVRSTFLIDGMVAGTWKAERNKTAVTLVITSFEGLDVTSQAALAEEGLRLIQFIEADATNFDIQFSEI